MNEKNGNEKRGGGFHPVGLSLGLGLGLCFGAALGNMGTGLCLGMGIGLLWCVILGKGK